MGSDSAGTFLKEKCRKFPDISLAIETHKITELGVNVDNFNQRLSNYFPFKKKLILYIIFNNLKNIQMDNILKLIKKLSLEGVWK